MNEESAREQDIDERRLQAQEDEHRNEGVLYLADVKLRYSKAAPAPWAYTPQEMEVERDGTEHAYTGANVAGPFLFDTDEGYLALDNDNAAFIAFAREDLPLAVEIIEKLSALLVESKREHEEGGADFVGCRKIWDHVHAECDCGAQAWNEKVDAALRCVR